MGRAHATVWCLPIAACRRALGDGARWLTVAERERVARHADRRSAARFMVGRAGLRLLLADRLDRDPKAVSIVEEASGRPRVADDTISFSVSHSGDLALVAIAEDGRLGVDVEALRPLPSAIAMARSALGEATATALERLPPAARGRSFLVEWTKLEARAKASGRPIDRALARAADGLHVRPLALPAGYVGAIAGEHACAPRILGLEPGWLEGIGGARPSMRRVAVARSEVAS